MKIETLLYLFFIILTVVVPLLRKKKNKAAVKPASKPKQTVDEEDDFFTTLQKQLEKLEVPTIVQEKQTEQYQQNDYRTVTETGQQYENYDNVITPEGEVSYENYEQNVNSYDNVTEDAYSYEDAYSQSGYSETYTIGGNQQLAETYSQGSDSQKESEKSGFHFDPVAAVVYTEVLKRPEY